MKNDILSTRALLTRFLFLTMAALVLAAAGPAQAQSDKSGTSGEGQTVQVDGTEIFYQTSGEGQPLLLIHGYPLNGDLFAEQRSSLSSQFKVVTPDLPGYGRSGALQEDGSIEAYADAMLGFMDELGIDKAVIGGHSMGGMTALQMYKQAPERFSGLMLIDTAAIAAPIPLANLWMGFAEAAEQKGDKAMIAKLLVPNMLSGDTRRNDEQLVKTMKDLIDAASTQGLIAGGHALAQRSSYVAVLSTIDVPTLIIVGAEDTVTPMALAKSMHKKISGSKLEIISGASHAAIIEAPMEANSAISEWWESQGASGSQ